MIERMTGPVPPASRPPAADEPQLREALRQLEARFLSEMLKAAGLGESRGLAAGPGEEQFASFLRDAQADAMSARGGIGLAEAMFRSMSARGEG